MYEYFNSIAIKNAGLLLEIRRVRLIALCCTHIACKYQEIYYPYITRFLKNEFSFEDYSYIEDSLLRRIQFKIQVPFDLDYINIIKKYFKFNLKYTDFMLQLLKIGLACNHLRRYDVKDILIGKFL